MNELNKAMAELKKAMEDQKLEANKGTYKGHFKNRAENCGSAYVKGSTRYSYR